MLNARARLRVSRIGFDSGDPKMYILAVLSPLPSERDAPPFGGMMRGSVLAYEDPSEPAAPPSEWAVLRFN